MPKLKTERETKKIKLPAPEGAECDVYTELTFGEAAEIMNAESDTEKGFKAVQFLIKSWNLEDEKGKVLPVVEENIRLLPISSANVLAEYATGLTKEGSSKKKD